MSRAPKYYVQVLYNGVNISDDITSHLTGLRYVDNVHGKSDEIEIDLEDSDAKWRNEWYPKKKDLLTVSIGPDKDSAFDCGVFWIDEIEGSGPPDIITIRGLATGPKGTLSTKKSYAHEGKTLREIAQTIAGNNGLVIDDGSVNNTSSNLYNLRDEADILRVDSRILIALVNLTDQEVQKALTQIAELNKLMQSLIDLYAGLEFSDGGTAAGAKRNVVLLKESTYASSLAIEFIKTSGVNVQKYVKAGVLDGIIINRNTQNHETDLGFLMRICNEYGIVFSIRNTTMFFTTVFNLEALPSSFTLNRNQLKSYSFKDKIKKVYKKAKVTYHNPVDKEVVESEYENPDQVDADGDEFTPDTSDDVLVVHSKSETKQQAEIKAQSALHSANSKSKEGSFTVDGNKETVLILAGNNFDLVGNGVLSGKYHVITSTHEITRGGAYEISADVKSVGTVPKVKNKSAAMPDTYKPQSQSPKPSASLNEAVNGFRAGIIQQ